MAIFPIAYYVVVGSGYTVFSRYILPVVPWLCLTAAFLVVEAARALALAIGRPQRGGVLTWGIAILVVAPSTASIIQFDRLLAIPDARLRGFRDIWRPGPNLTVYVRPDLARRLSN